MDTFLAVSRSHRPTRRVGRWWFLAAATQQGWWRAVPGDLNEGRSGTTRRRIADRQAVPRAPFPVHREPPGLFLAGLAAPGEVAFEPGP